jgi:hypothetical protein
VREVLECDLRFDPWNSYLCGREVGSMRKGQIVFCVILLSIGSLIIVSCSLRWLVKPTWEPPKVVSVEGADQWAAYPWPLYYNPVKKGQAAYLLLRDGDLLIPLSSAPFLYLDSDGSSFAVKCDEYRTELNGKTVSLDLEKEEAWEWLEKAMPEDLPELRLIVIGKELDDRRLQSLKRMSKVNPQVGLIFESNLTLQRVLPLFDPALLILSNDRLDEEDLAILSKMRNVRTLIIPGKMGDLSFLSKLPNLDTLEIAGWDPSISRPFPQNLDNLRRLTLTDSKIKNLAFLGKQPKLDELRLEERNEGSSIDSLDGISNLPALKELYLLPYKTLRDLSPLKQLRQLKWLSLLFTTTQEQLESIVRDHPDLVGLELFADKVTDLSPLKKLRNLKYLLVMTPNAELDPILAMKGLRWLAVSSKDKNVAEEDAAKIQKALPDTSVVLINPVCLGSGWILLLAPVALLAFWVQKRRAKAAQRAWGL